MQQSNSKISHFPNPPPCFCWSKSLPISNLLVSSRISKSILPVQKISKNINCQTYRSNGIPLLGVQSLNWKGKKKSNLFLWLESFSCLQRTVSGERTNEHVVSSTNFNFGLTRCFFSSFPTYHRDTERRRVNKKKGDSLVEVDSLSWHYITYQTKPKPTQRCDAEEYYFFFLHSTHIQSTQYYSIIIMAQ